MRAGSWHGGCNGYGQDRKLARSRATEEIETSFCRARAAADHPAQKETETTMNASQCTNVAGHTSTLTRASSLATGSNPTCRSSKATDQGMGSAARLTSRETEVLRLLVHGLTYTQISHQLGVSWNTVTTHIKKIYTKLNVHSGRAAVYRALELDLLGAPDGEPFAATFLPSAFAIAA